MCHLDPSSSLASPSPTGDCLFSFQYDADSQDLQRQIAGVRSDSARQQLQFHHWKQMALMRGGAPGQAATSLAAAPKSKAAGSARRPVAASSSLVEEEMAEESHLGAGRSDEAGSGDDIMEESGFEPTQARRQSKSVSPCQFTDYFLPLVWIYCVWGGELMYFYLYFPQAAAASSTPCPLGSTMMEGRRETAGAACPRRAGDSHRPAVPPPHRSPRQPDVSARLFLHIAYEPELDHTRILLRMHDFQCRYPILMSGFSHPPSLCRPQHSVH